MLSAIFMVAGWCFAGLAVAGLLLVFTSPRTALEIAKSSLDTLQGVGERASITWTWARAWRRRRRYVGTHRAPRFQVIAPVPVDA